MVRYETTKQIRKKTIGYWSYLENILNAPSLERHERRCCVLLLFVYTLTVPTLVIFAVYHFFTGRIILTELNVAIATLFLVFFFLLIKYKSVVTIRFVAEITVAMICVLLGYFFIAGVYDGVSVLWMFTLPTLTFLLLGHKEGGIWIIAIILTTGIILFFPENFGAFQYELKFRVRFYIVFLALSISFYGVESLRYRIENELVSEQKKLKEALVRVKTLSGLLPICASCKKIRDDKGYWNEIETYISSHSEAEFSHGMCKECGDKLYGSQEWYKKIKDKF